MHDAQVARDQSVRNADHLGGCCHRSPRWSHLVFRVMEPEAACRPKRILYEEATRVERPGGARESAAGSQRFFFRIGCSGLVAGEDGGGLSSRTLGLSLAR
jgi:hypothetical protein